MPAAPTELPGRYVKRGEVLGYVVDGPATLVRAAVTQEDMDLIRSRAATPSQVRLANDPAHAVRRARCAARCPAASSSSSRRRSARAAAARSRSIPSQQGGKRSLKRVFDIELELDRPSPSQVFGDRA